MAIKESASLSITKRRSTLDGAFLPHLSIPSVHKFNTENVFLSSIPLNVM